MALIKNLPFVVRGMSETGHIYETLDESSKKLLQSLIDKLIPGGEKVGEHKMDKGEEGFTPTDSKAEMGTGGAN